MQRRTHDRAFPGAERFLPDHPTMDSLRAAVTTCHGCPLYRAATQAVFGEGSSYARVVLVGEVPGDIEDRMGHPFVGPAGRLLDEALDAAAIARGDVYVTNAVKHFKFTRRGKRRIHEKPTRYEVRACRPWLDAELGLVHPEILVALGATAAQALFGPHFRVTQMRGVEFESPFARHTFATMHPSAVLRAPDHDLRVRAREELFADIALVGERLRAIEGVREHAGTKAAP